MRTRGQLPRTPLYPKNTNTSSIKESGSNLGRLANSRPRSAAKPPSKFPRASHARSTSPSRTPGPSTPSGRTRSVGRGARATTSRGGPGGGVSAEEAATINDAVTPQAARQAEEELLAAFSRTPKVARTPPGGVAARAAGEAVPAGRRGDGRLPVGAAPAARDAPSEAPRFEKQLKEHGSSMASAPTVPEIQGGSQRIPPQPAFGNSDNRRTALQNVARQPPPPLHVEPRPELMFGKSTKLARTPPRTDAGREATPGAAVARQGGYPPQQTGRGNSNSNRTSSLSSDTSTGTDAAASSSGSGSEDNISGAPAMQDTRSVEPLHARPPPGGGGGRAETRGGLAPPPPPQQLQRRQLVPSQAAPVAAVSDTRSARRSEPAAASITSAGGSPGSYPSPSASVDSSGANVANVRSLAGSAAKDDGGGGGVGGGFVGALTPAAFKGLTVGMRTPSTVMKRLGAAVNEVRGLEAVVFVCCTSISIIISTRER